MKFISGFFMIVVLVGFPLGVQAGPILVLNSGQLLGATGVTVEGMTYDVSFMDGNCIALFNGCDNAADDFPFYLFGSSNAARSASLALMAQVFLDGPDGNFDSTPSLTLGCEDPRTCRAVTPYSVDGAGRVGVSFARNFFVENTGGEATGVQTICCNPNLDGSGIADATWAIWTLNGTTPPDPAPVPEPSTMLLMGSGLIGLAAWRSRKIYG